MNTKKQGDVGLGTAIEYLTSQGYTVYIPLTDSQDHDLVVEICGKLKRVEVKRTSYKRHGSLVVSLTVKGGNRSSTGKIKKFNHSNVDYIFISTSAGGRLLIPTKDFCTQTLVLNESRVKYMV